MLLQGQFLAQHVAEDRTDTFVQLGVDPVWFGVFIVLMCELGMITPPVGMNLFIASYRFDKPIVTLYRATLPWLLILFACVLLITYWPWLSLVLVN